MEREGSMKKSLLATAALAALAFSGSAFAQATATPGQEVSMVLLPKFLGIAVFDQAHEGALEAQKELQNPAELQFLGPTPENSVAGQIEIVTNATTQGVDAIMISNNSGDQIVPAVKAANAKGLKVVTWDLQPSDLLAELGRIDHLPDAERASRVHAIAQELGLPRLARFFERTAVETA
jgi:ABC-type sugar transport system substrate-binding protein